MDREISADSNNTDSSFDQDKNNFVWTGNYYMVVFKYIIL